VVEEGQDGEHLTRFLFNANVHRRTDPPGGREPVAN
jgi:hypothetical protein